jgi:hypothetical protein
MERNYPKELPEWKAHRVLGYTHRGKTGMALGAASTIGGGYLGAMALRPEKKVSKAMGTDAFGVVSKKNKDEGTDLTFRLRKIPSKRRKTQRIVNATAGGIGGGITTGALAAGVGGSGPKGTAASAAGGALLGGGLGALAPVPKHEVTLEPKKIKKAYDPEERRHRRTGAATGVAGAGSLALGYAATKQGQKAKAAFKQSKGADITAETKINQIRVTGGKNNAPLTGAALTDSMKKKKGEAVSAMRDAKNIRFKALKTGGRAAALGAGAAAAGAGAVAINRNANKRGRTYRSWYDG